MTFIASNLVLPELKRIRTDFEPILTDVTNFDNWEEFILAVKTDPNILDWVMSELFTGSCGDNFVIPNFANQIESWYENDETEYFVVINVSGKFIMTKYSEYEQFIWKKIEFFFVEQETIMVPKLIWKITSNFIIK